MYTAAHNALPLGYRILFGIAAGWVVARLPPTAPMRHAAVLGTIGTALATTGGIVPVSGFELGPAWYPITIAIVAYPTVWLGAVLHERPRTRR